MNNIVNVLAVMSGVNQPIILNNINSEQYADSFYGYETQGFQCQEDNEHIQEYYFEEHEMEYNAYDTYIINVVLDLKKSKSMANDFGVDKTCINAEDI